MTERGVFDSRAPRSGESREDTLSSLRDLGIKIAIDDFGTGYSSLAYLKHWRVDLLKIDKSFVRDIVTDASDLAIVSAIIAIARNLHIEVIAEGIESYQQVDILEKLGCHHGQGFLFARPMPADKCQKWLGKRQSVEDELADMIDQPCSHWLASDAVADIKYWKSVAPRLRSCPCELTHMREVQHEEANLSGGICAGYSDYGR